MTESWTLKVECEGDVRRLKLNFLNEDSPAIKLEAIGQAISSGFSLGEVDPLHLLSYKDDEGNFCSLVKATIEDFFAQPNTKPLRLYMSRKIQPTFSIQAATPTLVASTTESMPQQIPAGVDPCFSDKGCEVLDQHFQCFLTTQGDPAVAPETMRATTGCWRRDMRAGLGHHHTWKEGWKKEWREQKREWKRGAKEEFFARKGKGKGKGKGKSHWWLPKTWEDDSSDVNSTMGETLTSVQTVDGSDGVHSTPVIPFASHCLGATWWWHKGMDMGKGKGKGSWWIPVTDPIVPDEVSSNISDAVHGTDAGNAPWYRWKGAGKGKDWTAWNPWSAWVSSDTPPPTPSPVLGF